MNTTEKEPVPLEVHERPVIALTDDERALLEKVALHFMFSVVNEGCWTTIYGPTLTGGAITLDYDTATVRLLSELGCAIAKTSKEAFNQASPLLFPLVCPAPLLRNTASAFRVGYPQYRPVFEALQQQLNGANHEQ